MRVLLIGNLGEFHVGAFFRSALEALGHEYACIDEGNFFRGSTIMHKLFYRMLNRRPLRYWEFNKEVYRVATQFSPDIVIVVKGAHISPKTLSQMKSNLESLLVNYATDDPFNIRINTPDLLAGIPSYDLYACTKRSIMDDIRHAGCAHVIYVPFGYEPSLHFPEEPATKAERDRFSCDLTFIGGSDSMRVSLMNKLMTIPDINLHLYGGLWNRDRVLRKYYRGFALGRDYRLALGGSKIALGLIRHTNRDGHSMRTFEIPACGTFMLGERTSEHLELFEEGVDAEFFDSEEELLDKVGFYLAHPTERTRIAQAGHERVIRSGHTYQNRLIDILRHSESLS